MMFLFLDAFSYPDASAICRARQYINDVKAAQNNRGYYIFQIAHVI
jgi:hypothetical protein